MNSLVKIKINKKTVTVKTNRQGVYVYNYKTTSKGTNNIILTFAGSTNYKKSSVKSTFKVKQGVNIYFFIPYFFLIWYF